MTEIEKYRELANSLREPYRIEEEVAYFSPKDMAVADAITALCDRLEAAERDLLKLQRSGQMAATCTHNNIVVMQAAWIEWKYGEGAEGAMEWIENTLAGPGIIPDPDEPNGREAQAYFDANRVEKLYDEALDTAIDALSQTTKEGA